jgi:hypothetical protein
MRHKTNEGTEGTARAVVPAWRVKDDCTVSECTLSVSDVPMAAHMVQWWTTQRGGHVLPDRDHSEYFTSEARAYEVALQRALHLERRASEAHNNASIRLAHARLAYEMHRTK